METLAAYSDMRDRNGTYPYASEIGEAIGITRQGMHSRFKRLQRLGFLRPRGRATTSRVYTITPQGRDALNQWRAT